MPETDILVLLVSFVVVRELFWGDDRLEDAIAWLGGTSPLQT